MSHVPRSTHEFTIIQRGLDEPAQVAGAVGAQPHKVSVVPMPDLAPMIHRQRLVIEGYCDAPISAEAIKAFLSELSTTIDMVALMEPVTHSSPLYGWAGWIHWETSGAHFYAWDQPVLFFSVDVYACKPFDARDAVDLAARHFGGAPVWKEF